MPGYSHPIVEPPAEILARVPQGLPGLMPGRLPHLRRRRACVWQLRAEGETLASIARILHVNWHTVKKDLAIADSAISDNRAISTSDSHILEPSPYNALETADKAVMMGLERALAAVCGDGGIAAHAALSRWCDLVYRRHGAYADAEVAGARGVTVALVDSELLSLDAGPGKPEKKH